MTFDIGDINANDASNSSIHTTTVTMSRKDGGALNTSIYGDTNIFY